MSDNKVISAKNILLFGGLAAAGAALALLITKPLSSKASR